VWSSARVAVPAPSASLRRRGITTGMSATTFEAHDPTTGQVLARYDDASDEAVASACAQAARAFPALREPGTRSRLLRAAARRLRAAAPSLYQTCGRETGLPPARLENELERTCVQLELFAAVVDEGSHVEAIIDTADPDAPVAPRPDLRRMLVPLGPVAVFGASNFPFAFSVAGGDTASALAAGCSVIVKGHPSHPGTSELVAAEIRAAVEEVVLPAGVFSMVHGQSSHVGQRLVEAPEIEAVGFTGSLAGGRALLDAASARPRPIPVYAEMGSVNPVLITSGALRERGDTVTAGLVASATAATGQFCTKPGVVLIADDDAASAFVAEVARRLDETGMGPLLNARIHDALRHDLAELDGDAALRRITADGERGPSSGYMQAPVAYEVQADTVTQRPQLLDEHFGPVVVFVRCHDAGAMAGVLDALGGQLTATLHAQPDELPALRPIIDRMEAKAGRVIFDGFPTGVAVTHAMHHGGPYPATTASLYTSVGSTAIRRFQRPVAWQNAPAELLPPELRDDNPTGIWRRVNGEWTREPV
jgi:alpha-ketoglutaric semialdehyde dehydrogenase